MNENSLVIFTKAAQLLAEADSVQKAKELKDLALTAADWAKRKDMGEEAIQYARSYALEAERKMGELLKAGQEAGTVAAPGRPNKCIEAIHLSELGLTRIESSQAQELAELEPEVFEAIKVGKKSRAQVHRERRETERDKRRKADANRVAQLSRTPNADVKYATIVVDPPWDWGDEGDINQMGRAKPDYATIPIGELMELPIASFSDSDCHLYLWVTNRSMPKAFALLEQWGFRYITILTWPKPSYGMGNYFRGQTEHVLFGIRGSQPLKRKDASTLLPCWARGPNGHGSKPLEFYSFVESCSPGPYLELFARNSWRGWTNRVGEI